MLILINKIIMTKQEFLAMSLPYGLKCCTVEINRINDLLSCHFGNIAIARIKPNDDIDFPLPIAQIKPILHPLSDLTKEIEHKGEKFKPSYKLGLETISRIEFYKQSNSDLEINIETPNYSTQIDLYSGFLIVQKLIEWHFDITDLISKGEAIDVNTLEVNPYK